MRTNRLYVRLSALLVPLLCCVIPFVRGHSVSAQDNGGASNLRPQRALAFLEAAERALDYVPGEVLIKFKPGVGATGQQQALSALRSRPMLSDLRWIADVALLASTDERDATLIAEHL